MLECDAAEDSEKEDWDDVDHEGPQNGTDYAIPTGRR